jgi:hypothetical protein
MWPVAEEVVRRTGRGQCVDLRSHCSELHLACVVLHCLLLSLAGCAARILVELIVGCR